MGDAGRTYGKQQRMGGVLNPSVTNVVDVRMVLLDEKKLDDVTMMIRTLPQLCSSFFKHEDATARKSWWQKM